MRKQEFLAAANKIMEEGEISNENFIDKLSEQLNFESSSGLKVKTNTYKKFKKEIVFFLEYNKNQYKQCTADIKILRKKKNRSYEEDLKLALLEYLTNTQNTVAIKSTRLALIPVIKTGVKLSLEEFKEITELNSIIIHSNNPYFETNLRELLTDQIDNISGTVYIENTPYKLGFANITKKHYELEKFTDTVTVPKTFLDSFEIQDYLILPKVLKKYLDAIIK